MKSRFSEELFHNNPQACSKAKQNDSGALYRRRPDRVQTVNTTVNMFITQKNELLNLGYDHPSSSFQSTLRQDICAWRKASR
ncbi:MAG: hypothetical protein KJ882_02620 [Proteobacteria bacterium]|nr:hypothetical protein [Pseudomonadota bacterium]